MSGKRLLAAASAVALAVLVAVLLFTQTSAPQTRAADCFLGVTFGGDTYEQAKAVIDKTKSYTNLFILQSGPISLDENVTRKICDYATSQGLSIVVSFGDLAPQVLEQKNLTWRLTFIQQAKTLYGDKFLGAYYYDERGGIWIDKASAENGWFLPPNATYDSVAQTFEGMMLHDGGTVALKDADVPVWCSDYTLYWFDYKSGYDVMLAEAGWNQTLAQDVALVRGAARFQHKDWGVIVTWKYTQPPYIADADEVYSQLRDAYKSGAKYLTVFDFPYNGTNPYGVMEQAHFDALQRLWSDIEAGKIERQPQAMAVLVLPQNYGWGMRFEGDKIWGFWQADEKSPVIWNNLQGLLSQYGYGLDVAYMDPAYPVPSGYQHVYMWNDTLP
jgi:hypothetical protein